MKMQIVLVLWIYIYLQNYVTCLKEYTGIDIGYSCNNDDECKAGNGGEYSKCNQDLNICICTINHLGEDKCMYDSDKYIGVCRRQTLYKESGTCTLECTPKGTVKWKESHDWYGEILQPFASLILDKKTSICYDPMRSFSSVPDGFEIKLSTIPNAGLGVFTNIYLEQNTVFGPYKGTFDPDPKEASLYSWKIFPRGCRDQTGTYWIDGTDIALSNWLRYFNTPTTAAMENTVALQHKGEMFYHVFKSIPPGTELFIWYGEEYDEYLEIEKFVHPSYYHASYGYVGGTCGEDEEGQPCAYDENTICAQEKCFCKPETHTRAGMCISDETLGGICVGSDGESCQHDENAECQRGICVCKNNSSPANGVCRPDEAFGGRCAGNNGHTCLLDNNAECVHGICTCIYGTSGIEGKCITDETYQGRCTHGDGEACELDKNAECWNSICICKRNASAVNGKCELVENK